MYISRLLGVIQQTCNLYRPSLPPLTSKCSPDELLQGTKGYIEFKTKSRSADRTILGIYCQRTKTVYKA